jgi:hypothetical protein
VPDQHSPAGLAGARAAVEPARLADVGDRDLAAALAYRLHRGVDPRGRNRDPGGRRRPDSAGQALQPLGL